MTAIRIHIATDPTTMEQVRQLNHRVYAEELGQDAVRTDGTSPVDPRMERGVCFVARDGDRLVGMLAITLPEQRFSIEDSVGSLPILPSQRGCTVELRRLAIPAEHRGRGIYPRLLDAVIAYCITHGYFIGIISAISEHVAMYQRLGFTAFGERYEKGRAEYLPMMLDIEALRRAGLDPRILPLATRAIEERIVRAVA